MSHEPSHSTEHLPPPEAQADEHVASFKIVAVGVIALLVFGAATVWSAPITSSPHTLDARHRGHRAH